MCLWIGPLITDEMILWCCVAVFCHLFALASLQYCSGKYDQGDPECGTTRVDGLELNVDCLNSSAVRVRWRNKTAIQLVWIEYICSNPLQENETIHEVVGGANVPNGSHVLLFPAEPVSPSDQHQSCALFACVYIDGQNCLQLNKNNATCSSLFEENITDVQATPTLLGQYPSVTVVSTDSDGSMSLITTTGAALLPSVPTTTATKIAVISATSSLLSSLHPTDSSTKAIPVYMVIIIAFMLLGFGVTVTLAFCTLLYFLHGFRKHPKISQDNEDENEGFTHVQPSVSICTLTGISMAKESIVTDVNSLAYFSTETATTPTILASGNTSISPGTAAPINATVRADSCADVEDMSEGTTTISEGSIDILHGKEVVEASEQDSSSTVPAIVDNSEILCDSPLHVTTTETTMHKEESLKLIPVFSTSVSPTPSSDSGSSYCKMSDDIELDSDTSLVFRMSKHSSTSSTSYCSSTPESSIKGEYGQGDGMNFHLEDDDEIGLSSKNDSGIPCSGSNSSIDATSLKPAGTWKRPGCFLHSTTIFNLDNVLLTSTAADEHHFVVVRNHHESPHIASAVKPETAPASSFKIDICDAC